MGIKSLSGNCVPLMGLLLLALLFAPGGRAAQLDVTWANDSRYSGELHYGDPGNWTPQIVPNNGNQGNTYRVTIARPGPDLDMDVTVDALTMSGGGTFWVTNHTFSSAFTRNDTSAPELVRGVPLSVLPGMHVYGPYTSAKADLGTLANYNSSTKTLEGGVYYVSTFEGGPTAELTFKGARIVTNAADVFLRGGGRIVDELGNDALQPLAVNNGLLNLSQTALQTQGDFTNNGKLYLMGQGPAVTALIVTGNLTNFDPATKTLTGGKYFTSDSTLLQFPGADVVNNSADLFVAYTLDGTATGRPTIADENGLDALRNFANNTASGRITFDTSNFTTTAARLTNAGYMFIARRYPLPAKGVYEQTGGELVLNLGSGSSGQFKGILDTQGGSISIHGGLVTGGGRLIGATTNAGIIAPGTGDLTPLTTFEGTLTLGSSSILRFDIAGTVRAPGAPSTRIDPNLRQYGYDAIDSTGSIVIDGQLQVNLSTATKSGLRFVPASSNTFILLKSPAPIVGSFRNVANGQRLRTTDGGGSFLVNYGLNTSFDPTAVVLSDFQPNTSAATLLNISTRGQVGSDERVLIGGFIVTGSEAKPVIMRGIGPSLRSSGITNVVEDPKLHLHDGNGTVIASNDDWEQSSQRTDVQATGIPPRDSREAAIVATLVPGAYTVVLESKTAGSGIGLFEVYDLDAGAQSQLANISTRGFADAGEKALIGGVIVGGGTGNTDVLMRALGPSLTRSGVVTTLEDPYIYLGRGGNGLYANDDWQGPQQAEIEGTGIPPSDDRESAIVWTLSPGAYTATVIPTPFRSGTRSGVGLIEFYRLR